MKLILSLFILTPMAILAAPIVVPPAQFQLVPSGTPTVGSKISIDVFLAPVTDLYSWQADIQYSPSTLSFASLQEGSFLSNFGPSFFIPGSIDAKNGVIADTAGTLLGNTNGPSGGGLLFTISFNVKSSGPAVIIVNNGILLDSSFNTTPAIPSSLNFTIVPIVGGTGPSSSPEPGSLAFVVAGGCLLLWLKRYFPRLARS